jgi:hypothetical protein
MLIVFNVAVMPNVLVNPMPVLSECGDGMFKLMVLWSIVPGIGFTILTMASFT